MAEELLSRNEVDVVTQFAAGLAAYETMGMGWWSPFLSNSLMQNLNNDAKVPTMQAVRKALQDYRNNADNIQSYMEYTRFFDMIFSRTVQAYINSLSFDLQYTCTNAYTASDYESDKYLADKKRVEDFLTKFNYKKEFRQVVQQIMVHEVYYTWFRKIKWNNKGMKYALQPLPQDRCLMTGFYEKGILFDFDMSYFLQAGTDINGFDPVFKKYYNRVFGTDGGTINNYRPTNQFNNRTGTYAMWTQTSPTDGAFLFKFDSSNFNTTPFLAPYLKMALTNDEVQQLQYNKDIAEAFAILAGEIETFNDAKSGARADQMVFNPKTLGQFMSKAKAGMASSVKLAALPVQNLKWYQYTDNNTDMLKTQLSTSAATGTGASRIIYATDRMSNSEVEAALNEMYQTMKPLYYQFSNFLDFYVNQQTKYYKFKFVFDGSTYRFERQTRFDNLLKLADKGMVLNPTAYASVLGMEPQFFEASLRESKHNGWVDNLQLLMNSNIGLGSDEINGRPETDTMDLTDSGEMNRDE